MEVVRSKGVKSILSTIKGSSKECHYFQLTGLGIPCFEKAKHSAVTKYSEFLVNPKFLDSFIKVNRRIPLCDKLVFLGLAIPIFLLLVPNVYASGIRGDVDEGTTIGESICWVNGYDSGFAGKFDKDRSDECGEFHENYYSKMWDMGCEDSLRTEEECIEIRNNPVAFLLLVGR